jgi:peptide/nickel transport system substrate-binding protein
MVDMSRVKVIGALSTAAIALTLVGCGSSSGNNGGGGKPSATPSKNATIVLGTTDTAKSLDPAFDYDQGGATIFYNIYQALLKIPPGGNAPVPDAAKSCGFTGKTTYTCTMNPGLTFSNGDPLNAAVTAASFKRMVAINDPNGPAVLLGNMKSVSANGNKVVFQLKSHDNTWPYVLTTLAANIVDTKVVPAKTRMPDDKVIGSGVYKISSYNPKQQIVLVPNPSYKGTDQLENGRFIVKFEQAASTLKGDIEQGNVDIAFRSLSPTDITSLRSESSRGVKVIEGPGAEIRYIVFNTKLAPGKDKAVRQAIAYLVDRAAIAKNVYDNQVTPLYSMVATGLAGHTDAFKTVYGATPNKAKAVQVLQKAHISTPIKTKLWYTPSHYGPVSADEWTEIARELNGSGLFKVTLASQEWDQYQNTYVKDGFSIFQLGWFPDYTDADDYLSPFYPNGGFFNNHYDNPKLDNLISAEKSEANHSKRIQDIEQAQLIGAQDAPTIPLWQSKQFAAQRDNISGFDKTLDRAYTFRFWLVSKS